VESWNGRYCDQESVQSPRAGVEYSNDLSAIVACLEADESTFIVYGDDDREGERLSTDARFSRHAARPDLPSLPKGRRRDFAQGRAARKPDDLFRPRTQPGPVPGGCRGFDERRLSRKIQRR